MPEPDKRSPAEQRAHEVLAEVYTADTGHQIAIAQVYATLAVAEQLRAVNFGLDVIGERV